MKVGDLISVRDFKQDRIYGAIPDGPLTGIITKERDPEHMTLSLSPFWVLWDDGTESIPSKFLLSRFEVINEGG